MKGTYCVLDDERDFLTVAERSLKKFLPDMKGAFTTDPEEAVNLARKDEPIIFIIDIVLVGKTGMEIYQRISSVSKKVRVIFITGDENFVNDENIRNQILLEGSIDLMEKPVKWHELAIKVKNNMQLLLYQCNLEEIIAERTQQLIHADRLATVGTMVSSIVHEISSPLTFIKANQEMCRYAYDKVKKVTDNKEVLSVFDNLILPSVEESMNGIERIEELLRESPYKSPTDMGVNMIGSCISDDEVCRQASLQEIIRRYYTALCNFAEGKATEAEVNKLVLLMKKAGISTNDRKTTVAAHERLEKAGGATAAIELEDGTILTAETSPLLGPSAALLLNALKHLAGIPHNIKLIPKTMIAPIQKTKVTYLHGHNPRLHTDEVLVTISMMSLLDENCKLALDQLPKLKGAQVHSTVMLSEVDRKTFKKLGIDLTCDPVRKIKDPKTSVEEEV